MNAISRTPKLHREELLKHVYLPSLVWLAYTASILDVSSAPLLRSLGEIYTALDINKDPYVLRLQAEESASAQRQLKKALLSGKTYCQDEIKSLYNKSVDIYHELGGWAAEFYIISCIQRFQRRDEDDFNDFVALEHEERAYLRSILNRISMHLDTPSFQGDGPRISPKVRCLIRFLVGEVDAEFTGLVFVKTRAAVAVLAHLLSIHPSLKDMVRVSTFVGTSVSANRKSTLGELLDVRLQRETLDDLRCGRRNLVIATTVLEEGIDVSACNLVVCFEKPANLKSFIQRRGRARKFGSKFVIMQEQGDKHVPVSDWQELEEVMKQVYMNDMRNLQQIQDLEAVEEDSRGFQVEATGSFTPPCTYVTP